MIWITTTLNQTDSHTLQKINKTSHNSQTLFSQTQTHLQTSHTYTHKNLNTLIKLTCSQNKLLTDTTCIFQLKQIYQIALRNPLYVPLRAFSPCGRISKVTKSFAIIFIYKVLIIFFHVQWISIFLFNKIIFFSFHIKKNPHLVEKPKPNIIRNLMQYLMVYLYNT